MGSAKGLIQTANREGDRVILWMEIRLQQYLLPIVMRIWYKPATEYGEGCSAIAMYRTGREGKKAGQEPMG